MNQVLYDKYKVVLGEQLKKDILEVAIAVYGEKRREQFEQNMNRIQIHTKITWEMFNELVKQQLADKLKELANRYRDVYGIEAEEMGVDPEHVSDIDYRVLSKEQRQLRQMTDSLFGVDDSKLIKRDGDRLVFNIEFAQTSEQRTMIQRSTSRI